jgi:hypothetical protein
LSPISAAEESSGVFSFQAHTILFTALSAHPRSSPRVESCKSLATSVSEDFAGVLPQAIIHQPYPPLLSPLPSIVLVGEVEGIHGHTGSTINPFAVLSSSTFGSPSWTLNSTFVTRCHHTGEGAIETDTYSPTSSYFLE